MKNLILLCCLLAVACKRQEPDPFAAFWSTFQGEADASINGKPAKANGYDLRVRGNLYRHASWDSSMAGITLIRVTPQIYQREIFGIGYFPPYRTGRYRIYRSESVANHNPADKTNRSILFSGNSDFYFVLPTEDNYINITYFDKEEIRGEFHITYLNQFVRYDARDTIRFTNGTFRTKITVNIDEKK